MHRWRAPLAMRLVVCARMHAAVLAAAMLVSTNLAHADQALPPLPPPADQPAPTPPPVGAPGPSSEPSAPPPAYHYAPPPPGPRSLSRADRKHAPAYSLWLGVRAGLLAHSGALYLGDYYSGSSIETTSDFVRSPGFALEGDIGARLASRYIPYVVLEAELLEAGRRFDGISTKAGMSFVGVGFRYLAGDVDTVSFASDISLGYRKLEVSNATGRWSAGAFELFRLGLGAEIRLSTSFTLSPMLTVSGGSVTDTSGSISFAPNQPDMLTGPPTHGIPSSAQQSYFVMVLGCGAHFDLFGK